MHSPFRHTTLPQTTTPWLAAQGHDLTDDWLLASAISLTACAHFDARLGAFFYWTRCFENNVPFDNTSPIYLINLLWKLKLEFTLDSELHYFSIFHRE